MAANYVLLETVTVGAAGAASVTFNNIPQSGYTDLQLVLSARYSTSSYPNAYISFNGSTSTFSTVALYGDGATPASTSGVPRAASYNPGSSQTASTFGSTTIYIPNYTSSNNKSYSIDTVSENNGTTAYAGLFAGLWSNTAAITQITITPDTGNFVQYTTASLYGIAAVGSTPVIAPKATGGDIIDYDGTYWIHTFLSSGTFTPATALSCDYLVVAGGGGSPIGSGVNSDTGGGGAGGLRSTVTATGGGGSLESKLSVSSGVGYTVTVGAGGAGVNGSDSTFSTITSVGGGKGGDGLALAGNGGSGGGGSNTTVFTGGTGTANQGYAGGTYVSDAGGGGGAGAVGGNNGGTGGIGVAVSITGSSVYYAGGGGGGEDAATNAGGLGGGGASVTTGKGVDGTANTGGGAGGSGGNAVGASSGGSGIVIVRYLAA